MLPNDFSPIVRKHERKKLHPSPGVTYHLLSKNLQGRLEFLLAIYDVGASTGPNRIPIEERNAPWS